MLGCLVTIVPALCAAQAATTPAPLSERYDKREVRIPMRDGAQLFTAIYTPRSTGGPWPILLRRTPYSVRPYGENEFPTTLGPSRELEESGYIFALQDVRGCYMSEGQFVDMRPHQVDKLGVAFDEASDAYDTVEWLTTQLDDDNGKVGMWGISYPGFYAATGMIDAHPALAAVSPQAPIADWYFDDFHHHGAFFLPHAFNFLAGFGRPRPLLTTERSFRFEHGTPDGYRFFLDLGPLSNANARYFKGQIATWNDMLAHPNYDEFWSSRNLLPHLRNVAPAVMTVGGWFDAEDLYGPLQIYRAIERQDPQAFNVLVMGPWPHGGWARDDGTRLGNVSFGGAQSAHYRAQIEFRFFEHFLKGSGEHGLAEANVFETGTNRWRSFDAWPPREAQRRTLYLRTGERLAGEAGDDESAFDEFTSDPREPVPYTQAIAIGMTREYMTDDQRFAERRADVLEYQSEVLDSAWTLAGPLAAELIVSTSREDADWIVKLIDVFPGDAPDPEGTPAGVRMGGYQMLVRSEVLRGRFRESYALPKPFVPLEPTRVRVELQDVLHTFAKGHRLMVQVQSTWFPLVDRNPQQWVDNIFEARESDFAAAQHRVWHSPGRASRLEFTVLP
ncbi:MAG: CocE/NonD family hydrolase [Planctomycetes bacterium]|nr:CocE/NonD family hydrolase [Planctomycetota bacterium]